MTLLNVLNVLIVPKDASLGGWALFLHISLEHCEGGRREDTNININRNNTITTTIFGLILLIWQPSSIVNTTLLISSKQRAFTRFWAAAP